MKMRLLLLFAACFIVENAIAQDRPNYQLLWQIQKEGKSQGYLFGTMHVTDEEAYDMSDSVLVCLDRCDQVAFEINFDELTDNLFSDIVQSYVDNKFDVDLYEVDDESVDLEKIIPLDTTAFKPLIMSDSDEETEHEKSSSKQKNKSKKEILETEEKEPESKFTSPLDMYLHNRAKFHGQKIVGLEVIEDQMRFFIKEKDDVDIKSLPDSALRKEFVKFIYEEAEQKSSEGRNTFLEIYQQGDIAKIDSIFKAYAIISGDINAFNMLSRNIVMADGIDSLLNTGTLFAAVGAAHLPGEAGVIELLRAKGYQLSPVKATFTGLASNMLSEELVLPGNWTRFRIPNGSFSVEMPKTPDPLNYGGGALTMYYSLDITNMKIYMSMEQKKYNAGRDPKVLDELVQNISILNPNAQIKSTQDIPVEGAQAKEVYYSIPEGDYRVHLIGKNDNIFMLMCGGPPGIDLQNPDFERYFSSIIMDQTKPNTQQESELEWKNYHSPMGSFSVDLMGETKEMIQKIQIDEDHFSKLRIVMNGIPSDLGIMNINLLTPSNATQYYNIQALSNIITDFKSEAELENQIVEEKSISVDGFPAKLVTKKQGEEVKSMLICMHGNTIAFFEYQCPQRNLHIFEHVISSFRWEPLEPAAEMKYTMPDHSASVITYGPMTKMKKSAFGYEVPGDSDELTWSLNDHRSTTYSELTYKKLSPLFFHAYPDSLLMQTAKEQYSWFDSIVTTTFIKEKKQLRVVAHRDSTIITHSVYQIAGDRLYSYKIEIPSDWKDIKKIDDIIESFTVDYNSDFDITKNRLIENIARIEENTDQNNNYQLINDFRECQVATADSSMLILEWFKNRSDDSLSYGSIFEALTTHLLSIHEVDFLRLAKQKFHSTESSSVQLRLLELILNLNTNEALHVYFELYPQLKPHEVNFWEPVPSSYDTDYYAKHLGEIIEFSLKHPSLSDNILNQIYYATPGYEFINQNNQDSVIALYKKDLETSLLNHEAKVLQLMESALANRRSDSYFDVDASSAYLIALLPRSNKSIEILNNLKPEKGSLGDYEVLKARMHHNLKISKSQKTSVLESPYGFTLVKELKESGQLKEIPKKYLEQSQLDRLYLCYIMYDDEDGTKVEVKWQKKYTRNVGGKEYELYAYSVKWIYDEEYGDSEVAEYLVGPHQKDDPLTFEIEPFVHYDLYLLEEPDSQNKKNKEMAIEKIWMSIK